MFTFVLGLLLAIAALAVLIFAFKTPATVTKTKSTDYGRTSQEYEESTHRGPWIAGSAVVLVIALFMVLWSFAYTQPVGTGKVITKFGGGVVSQDITPGLSYKSPWQSLNTWNLRSQKLTFVGNDKDGTPKYAGGKVTGGEVTASVKGGALTNIDVIVTYSLDGKNLTQLYTDYRDQSLFTEQVIVPKVLSVIRQVPSNYDPIPFRGEKRGEAQQKMKDQLANDLKEYGIRVNNVEVQKISYTTEVEKSIKDVEVSQQKKAAAEADQRAAEVVAKTAVIEAQGKADAAVAAATGQSKANDLLTQSLTPQVLQQRYIDALKAGTVFVVPEGSTPLVQAVPQVTK